MSRTKNSALNLILGGGYTLMTLALAFISTPLLLRWLGQERFGAFRALQDWLGYATIFEYGLGGALMARFAVSVGKNDTVATRSLIVAGFRLYWRITLLTLGMGLIWVIGLPWVVTIKNIEPVELRFTGLLMALAVIMTPLSVFRWLAEARQRSYVVTLLLTIQSLVTIVLLLGAAWAEWGLIGQGLIATIVAAILPICLLLGSWSSYPGLRKEPVQQETMKDLWALNRQSLVFNFSVRFNVFTDNMTIAWGMGAGAVTSFFLTQRMANIALTQLQGIGNATWAGLTELYVQGNTSVFKQRLLELSNIISSVGICILVPIAVYNRYFIIYWVGPENFAGDLLTLVSCCNMWLWGIFSFWGWPISGTGNIGKWVPYGVIAMLINVAVSLIGVLKLGFIGPLLGTTAGFLLVYSWSMPLVIKRVFQVQPVDLWKSALTPLLWGIPYAVLVWGLARRFPPQHWFELLFWLGLTALLGAAGWWALGINREVRSLWVMRLRLALGK